MARDLDRDLRNWGRRPPRTSPGVAAVRLVSRLPMRPRRRLDRRLFAAAAAVVLVVSIGVGRLALRTNEANVAVLETPLLGDNMVLWWIDPETPVYFALSPPERQ